MTAEPTSLPTLDNMVAQSLAGPRDSLAMLWEGREFDWGWTVDMADQIDAALRDAMIPPDAPVALVTRQQPDCCAAFMSLLRARRTIVMVYSYQSPEAMAKDVDSLGVAAIVASAADWTEPMHAVVARLGALGIAISPEGHITPLPRLDRPDQVTHRAPSAEPSIELLTSGTSGPPKRYPASFEALRRTVFGPSNGMSPNVKGAGPLQIFVPISNISGVMGFLSAVVQRRPMELMRKFSLDRWLDHIREYRPKSAGLPPAAFKMILDSDVPPEHLSSLEFVSHGMGAVHPVVREGFEARFGIPILSRYGATEFLGAAASMNLDDHRRYGAAKRGSVGRAVPNVELRVLDEQTGEVLPRGDAIGLLEVLHHDLGESWIYTNDLANVDEDGFLYLHGRVDGVINRGGFKVHPGAVESALLQHPAVATASVVGIAHEVLGAVPVAAIELRDGAVPASENELKDHLRQILTAPSVPTSIKWVDALPRTQSGKIRLDGVRALFADETVS